MTALVERFGIAVRQLRVRNGWTQDELAWRSGLDRSYVGEIERGCVIASLVTVEKLAVALNLSASALVTRGENITQINHARGIRLAAIAC